MAIRRHRASMAGRRGGSIGADLRLQDSSVDSFNEVFVALNTMLDALPAKQRGYMKQPVHAVEAGLREAFEAVSDRWQKDVTDAVHREAKLDPKGWNNIYRHMYRGGNPSNVGSSAQALFQFTGTESANSITMNLEVFKDYAASWSPVSQGTQRVGGEDAGEDYPAWEGRAVFAFADQLKDGYYSRLNGVITGQRIGEEGPKYIIKPYADRYFFAEKFTADYSSSMSQKNTMIEEFMSFTANQLTSMMDRSVEQAVAETFRMVQAEASQHDAEATLPHKGQLGRGRTRKGLKSMTQDGAHPQLVQKYGKIFANAFRNAVEGQV